MKKNTWKKYTEEKLNELNKICEDYKNYLNLSPTHLNYSLYSAKCTISPTPSNIIVGL